MNKCKFKIQIIYDVIFIEKNIIFNLTRRIVAVGTQEEEIQKLFKIFV